ncbi:hypothetical protein CERSUDRAFT_71109 [Gelatoporia subvermispora B]|uniref:Uncharacterized protein n=1 Tax=Ceriporiopsis subvermispora (strain B) TaxID=914234 RepID=M2R8V8_CERS8|nr:hypothetical protein CERSUDRAFT_71109 [Gelatoporia subvermispora B]
MVALRTRAPVQHLSASYNPSSHPDATKLPDMAAAAAFARVPAASVSGLELRRPLLQYKLLSSARDGDLGTGARAGVPADGSVSARRCSRFGASAGSQEVGGDVGACSARGGSGAPQGVACGSPKFADIATTQDAGMCGAAVYICVREARSGDGLCESVYEKMERGIDITGEVRGFPKIP